MTEIIIPATGHGQMFRENWGNPTSVYEQGKYHPIHSVMFTGVYLQGFAFGSGSEGAISSIANDGSGKAEFTTDAAHGLSVGDPIAINNTTNYDTWGEVTDVSAADKFKTGQNFSNNDTGNWQTPDYLEVDGPEFAGDYLIVVSLGLEAAAANKKFRFYGFINNTVLSTLNAQEYLVDTNPHTIGFSGLMQLADGDRIGILFTNDTDATDITFRNAYFTAVRAG